MSKILIVEDDLAFGTMLNAWFARNGYHTELTARAGQAREMLGRERFSLVLTDLRLPDGDGIMLLEWVKQYYPDIPVIIMTSYADIQSAVSAIKLGAADYLEKPINPTLLKEKIAAVLTSGASPKVKTVDTRQEKPGVVYGETEAARTMHRHIKLIAPTRMSVLIRGESGTGKEYVARLIHENSDRKDAAFFAVDCGRLSAELAPSELFGHLKGAFTTALADKKGVFEEADGGTIFLDEIGNLPPAVQVQLLRALQERKFRPVGSSSDRSTDVRIITATNENLEEAIEAGKFREDLYHRINEFAIEVPPLRERKKDIPLFAEHFLGEVCAELGKNIAGFSPETMEILRGHYWRGNLRELRNVVRRAALFCPAGLITPGYLPSLPENGPAGKKITPLKEDEKERIEDALKSAGGNKTLAARMLGIDRKTLYNKIHQYGLTGYL